MARRPPTHSTRPATTQRRPRRKKIRRMDLSRVNKSLLMMAAIHTGCASVSLAQAILEEGIEDAEATFGRTLQAKETKGMLRTHKLMDTMRGTLEEIIDAYGAVYPQQETYLRQLTEPHVVEMFEGIKMGLQAMGRQGNGQIGEET